jgi:site-specific recombinase XerD
MDFLGHIERERGNGATTRNLRLATIKTFMRYVEYQMPSALEQIGQIHAIPTKRHDQTLIRHLVMEEVRAILNAPDLTTRLGIRDRAMMHLCFAAGLRVSELVEAMAANLTLLRTPNLLVKGKGRNERCLPLWKETAADLRAWLTVRGNVRVPELFVNAESAPMTRSGFEYILDKHVRTAAKNCPSLRGRSVTPHQLRHSCAVIMLQATHDIRKVALCAWARRHPYHGGLPSHGSFRKARGGGSGHSARVAPRTVQGARRADRLSVGGRISIFGVRDVGQPTVTTKYLGSTPTRRHDYAIHMSSRAFSVRSGSRDQAAMLRSRRCCSCCGVAVAGGGAVPLSRCSPVGLLPPTP